MDGQKTGWYPGHMEKTKRELHEYLKLVDVVIELLDARIPQSGKNPDIDKLAENKRRVIVLNKSDLADDAVTKKWISFYTGLGYDAVAADATKGIGMKEITAACMRLTKEKTERQMARGRVYVPVRAMVAGIPNVGKSTFINKYTGRSVTKTGDKPGVTKTEQWVRIKKGFELLDTPGILWPKLRDETTVMNLALTNAIKDDELDMRELGWKLIGIFMENNPAALRARYNVAFDNENAPEILERIGEARGYRLKGGDVDVLRTSRMLVDEYRSNKIARLTLEQPGE